jgi:hypothetical protein
MALQLGALRDALLNAGATAEKADRAAEELAGYETPIASIDGRLSVLTWMVGFNLVLTAGVLWRLLAN